MTNILDAILDEVEKPPMQPTPEQEDIINAALNTQDNLLINALAGAAKTTTLEMICQRMPVMPILSLAFNKRIADEMAKRLPGNVTCRTLNALGHRVWASSISKKVHLNTKKSYEILSEKINALKPRERREAWDCFPETLKAVAKAKIAGYIPDGTYEHAKRLTASEDFWASLDDEEVDQVLVDETLTESIRQAYNGHIDFDDQIFMSTLFGGSFPRFPLILCDEVQDFSAINIEMLNRLVTQRLCAVGDPNQSIYRFRGAQSTSMAVLKDRFQMREMTLSISFRCPIEVIKNARFRAPHMMWPEWAKQGRVVRLEGWNAEDIPDGAAILCRNNAPLFKLGFQLLRKHRGIKLVGFDVGPNLIRTLKKLGPETLTREEVLRAIDRWEAEKLLSSKGEATVRDKAECLRVFCDFGTIMAEIIAWVEELFKTSGPIQLLSGHKSKGLEWDHVYHLDPWRIPSPFAVTDEDLEQEQNVRYVIETRAKDTLYFVDSMLFGVRDEQD